MGMRTQYHVTWRIHPQLDLIQMSGVLCGLADLEHSGVIELAIEFSDEVDGIPVCMMDLDVQELQTGRRLTVAIDFFDPSGKFSQHYLDRCDVYLKRQYAGEAVRALPQNEACKIKPLGLTLCGFSRRSWRLVAAAIFGSLRTRKARAARSSWRDLLRQAATNSRLWLAQLPPGYVATLPPADRNIQVTFQPRLWRTTPGSGDIFDIANDDRMATVQALRGAFGSDHTIGLVHSRTPQKVAPELQLRAPVDTRSYFGQLSRTRIAVNCVGLSGSVGWKFAEYLAAGNAVVSQPIDKELEPPIEAGIHYLPYRNAEECVAQCHYLLDSPDIARRMGAANRAYYNRWVDPPAMVAGFLRRAFSEN